MNPELILPFDAALTLLSCPNCGHNNTHHTVVDVYDRSEDRYESRTRVGDDAMKAIGNPSSRRNGLNIGFYCEQCPQRFWLRLEQHKGETYLSTERGEFVAEEDEARGGNGATDLASQYPEPTIEELLRSV